jgi:PTH1 family peptidyl-tRNA hydrolase
MTTWAIVGLGNPGSQYALNRHNIGFMIADYIQDAYRAPPFKIKQNTAYTEVIIGPHKIYLIKPQTFMNLSGRGVSPLISFFKIPLENVIVFHDELDLEPGRARVKRGGSSGGHNGLKSLDSTIGQDYWRVRIGIGHPGHKDAVSDYVLSNFKNSDLDGWVPDCLIACAKNLNQFLDKQEAATYAKSITTGVPL